jgi:hypothetical protein
MTQPTPEGPGNGDGRVAPDRPPRCTSIDDKGASAAGWVALPVGRADDGPTIAELVEAVKAAGGMVGGDALYDPRYEAEMRRFLIRALEMEGIPLPKGGGRP